MPNRRCRGLVGHGAPTFSGALNPRCKRRGVTSHPGRTSPAPGGRPFANQRCPPATSAVTRRLFGPSE